jgi:hypothetical protein
MMQEGGADDTLDAEASMESTDLEAAVASSSYQANAKTTRSLITEGARAAEKKFFGQTKQQLKGMLYLGLGTSVTWPCCSRSPFFPGLRSS